MGISINVSGVWKADPPPSINVSGVWKTADQVSINVAGVWKDMLASGPTVSPRADGDSNYRYGATCYVGCYFYTTGTEYELTNSGGVTNSTTWLDSGSSSDVWVEFVRTSGSVSAWTGKSNSTRYQISSNQNFYYTCSVAQAYRTLTGYFRMWDAASGGSTLWTGSTVSWIAEAEGGGCPLCCFTPDTLVKTARGLEVPIASVREGDLIMQFDPEEQKDHAVPVKEVIVREDVPMFQLGFEDGRTIRTSPDHPFHTEGKGPANVGWRGIYKDVIEPGELVVGDRIATQDGGWLRITSIKRVANEPYVYTFSNSLFYANGLLVY